MNLESKVKLILNKNNIFEGDKFICKRTPSAPVSRRYQYVDGKIKTMQRHDIKPLTVKNLIIYYTFIKEGVNEV